MNIAEMIQKTYVEYKKDGTEKALYRKEYERMKPKPQTQVRMMETEKPEKEKRTRNHSKTKQQTTKLEPSCDIHFSDPDEHCYKE